MAAADRAIKLMDLARSAPFEALDRLEATLSAADHGLDGTDLSIALRAGGLAARATGELARSRVYLEDAISAAEAVGDETRAVEGHLTLAGNEFLAGDPEGAVVHLGTLRTDDPMLRARIRYQAGTILARAGKTAAAVEHFDAALDAVRNAGNDRMMGMVLKNRAMLRLLTGDYEGAGSDVAQALRLFGELGMDIEVAYCLHNTGLVAAHSGDLPGAFHAFADAEERIHALTGAEWEIQAGHYQALLAAGLADEAATMASAAAERLELADFQIDRAEALGLKAEAEAAMGRREAAEESARLAVEVFREQGREAFAAAADLTRIRVSGGAEGGATAREHAAVLAEAGMADAELRARLLAAELDAGDGGAALAELSRRVRRAPFDVRLEHAAAVTEARWVTGDRRGAATAAASGARLVESYQALIGLSDMRLSLRSTAAKLYDVGLAAALASGRNRRLFAWMERTAMASSLVRHPEPVDDPDLRRALTELSAMGRVEGRTAHRRRVALEHRIRTLARTRALHLAPVQASLESVVTSLRERTMVRFAVVQQRMVGLRLRDGRLRRFDLGPAADLVTLKRTARAALTRAAAGRQRKDRDAARETLAEVDSALLAPLGIGDDAVVIVAPPALADVPWSGLPSRTGVSTVVARSAAGWLEADAAPPAQGPTVVVEGPDLEHASREADAVVSVVADAVHAAAGLDIDTTLGLMDGAGVVHVVSHGELRSDNPLFSSLRLHGGNLFAYQLQRVERAPAVAVLSACHLGLGSGRSGARLLGFTDALLAAGAGSVVASSLPVPDTSVTVDMMADLHRRMAGGARPAAALAAVQGELPADVAPLYAAAFTCFGSG